MTYNTGPLLLLRLLRLLRCSVVARLQSLWFYPL